MKIYEYQFEFADPALYVSDVELVQAKDDYVLFRYEDVETKNFISLMLHNCGHCHYNYSMKPMFCFMKLSDEQIDKVKRYIVRKENVEE